VRVYGDAINKQPSTFALTQFTVDCADAGPGLIFLFLKFKKKTNNYYMLNAVYIRGWGLTYFLGFLKRFLRDLSKLAICLYMSFL